MISIYSSQNLCPMIYPWGETSMRFQPLIFRTCMWQTLLSFKDTWKSIYVVLYGPRLKYHTHIEGQAIGIPLAWASSIDLQQSSGRTSASVLRKEWLILTFQNWLPSSTPPTFVDGLQLNKVAYATWSLFGYFAVKSNTMEPTYIYHFVNN